MHFQIIGAKIHWDLRTDNCSAFKSALGPLWNTIRITAHYSYTFLSWNVQVGVAVWQFYKQTNKQRKYFLILLSTSIHGVDFPAPPLPLPLFPSLPLSLSLSFPTSSLSLPLLSGHNWEWPKMENLHNFHSWAEGFTRQMTTQTLTGNNYLRKSLLSCFLKCITRALNRFVVSTQKLWGHSAPRWDWKLRILFNFMCIVSMQSDMKSGTRILGHHKRKVSKKKRLVYHNSRDILICHSLSWCFQPVQSFRYPSSTGSHDLTSFRATLLYVHTFTGIFRYICIR